jgi:hypothetical protein
VLVIWVGGVAAVVLSAVGIRLKAICCFCAWCVAKLWAGAVDRDWRFVLGRFWGGLKHALANCVLVSRFPGIESL